MLETENVRLANQILNTYGLSTAPIVKLVDKELLTIEIDPNDISCLDEFSRKNSSAAYGYKLPLYLETRADILQDQLLQDLTTQQKQPPILIKQPQGSKVPIYYIYGKNEGESKLTRFKDCMLALNYIIFETGKDITLMAQNNNIFLEILSTKGHAFENNWTIKIEDQAKIGNFVEDHHCNVGQLYKEAKLGHEENSKCFQM